MENIQVVERAFRLLESVAQGEGRPCLLGGLAAKAGLNPATAARIAHTLTELGYLDQSARRKGYVLGRKVFRLVRGQDSTPSLLAAAQPLMQEFSDRTGEYICLSGLRDNLRVLFSYILATHPVQVTGRIEHSETPYRSVSGHLLLAALPRSEQVEFFDRNGLPGAYWPQIHSREEFLSTLDRIRADGRIVESRDDCTAIAMPVRDCDRTVAALGVYLPTYRFKGERQRLLLRLLQETAEGIGRLLP